MATAALDRARDEHRDEQSKLHQRIRSMRQKHEAGIEATMTSAIVVGASFAGSYLEGAYPEGLKLIGDLPLTLVAGGALVALAAFEVGGREQSVYIAAAGQGLLAAWAAGVGGQMGRDAAVASAEAK